MINIGVIGYGYWGPNLVRNFCKTEGCSVTHVADLNEKRLKTLVQQYPFIETTTSSDDLINNPKIDAVIIATPAYTHFQLAKKALLSGKHVIVEKPMTTLGKEAEELIALAQKNETILMPDHTYLYTSAVKIISDIVKQGILGEIQYIDSVRINLGLFQSDINVLWDLAPHDLAICSILLKERPIAVQATGISHTNNNIENIGYLTLFYPSNKIAHLTCSWTSPVKVRHMLIGGDKKMIVFNDLETTEKIKVYDSGYKLTSEIEKNNILVDYRVGDILVPKVPIKEALEAMAEDFVAAVNKKKNPLSDHNIGLEIVQILEAAQKSIKQRGKEIYL